MMRSLRGLHTVRRLSVANHEDRGAGSPPVAPSHETMASLTNLSVAHASARGQAQTDGWRVTQPSPREGEPWCQDRFSGQTIWGRPVVGRCRWRRSDHLLSVIATTTCGFL